MPYPTLPFALPAQVKNWGRVLAPFGVAGGTLWAIQKLDASSLSFGLVKGWIKLSLLTCSTVYGEYVLFKYSATTRAFWAECFSTRLNESEHNHFQTRFVLPGVDENGVNTRAPMPASHSHQKAAAERTGIDRAIDDYACAVGRVPYTISMSRRNAGDGVHFHHWAKDSRVPNQETPLRPHHLIKLVDVDYYLDMPSILSTGNQCVLYTMQPRSLTGRVGEGHYRFVDDAIEQNSDGGGYFHHRIWNYSRDYLLVKYWWGAMAIAINILETELGKRVVSLTPERKFYGPLVWLMEDMDLRRFRVTGENGVNRLDVSHGGERWTSVGVNGKWTSVEMPTAIYEAAEIRFHANKSKVYVSSMEQYLKGVLQELGSVATAAATLYEVFRLGGIIDADYVTGGAHPAQPENFYSTGRAEDGYLETEEPKLRGRLLAPPIVENPAVVPAQGYNNDLVCVLNRVTAPNNIRVPANRYLLYAQEFVALVVPEPGKGLPYDLEQIVDLQDSPRQRERAQRTGNWVGTSVLKVKAFLKAEAYTATNDPRNISQCDDSHQMRLSTFTYAFKEQLKTFEWYAPGLSPEEIVDRLKDIAETTSELAPTDFSRYDGTISIWLRRNIEFACYLRWVDDDHRSELSKLLSNELGAKATTQYGFRYDVMASRMSGSPLTTDGNTLINAFVSYCAARWTDRSPAMAFKCLGLYGGDDGLSWVGDLPRAASGLGLKIKIDPVVRGTLKPLPFLGRIFPDIWNDRGSFQDPIRTLGKLHISFAPLDIPDEDALINKARGYLEMDPIAPVVSAWCRGVLNRHNRELGEEVLFKLRGDLPYWHAAWPQCEDEDTLWTVYASMVGLTADELADWHYDLLNQYDGLTFIPRLPVEDKRVTRWGDIVPVHPDVPAIQEIRRVEQRFNDANPRQRKHRPRGGQLNPGRRR
jgi:hypothetical protein